MSAVPENFMAEYRESGKKGHRENPQASADESDDANDSLATFWQWFALAVLLFAWVAEATMCADRGF